MKTKIQNSLKSQIESILLVAEKPVAAKELASCVETMTAQVQKALAELIEDYAEKGIKIIKKGDYYSMVTAPENGPVVAKFLNEELRHDLSDAAIETLSIITYKQPVTRVEIEDIRGVQSDQIIRNLMIRGLIGEVGRKEAPGRPILYGTTMEFLQYFGIASEKELPKFEEPEVLKEPELLINIDSIQSS
jgi:segregation and condensation protein B